MLVSYAAVDPLAPEPRRPRPVAGLPAVDSRAVAKAWLLELIAGATLEEAVELPTAELAREGPGLASAVLAALADDTALKRLARGGNLAWLAGRAAGVTGAPAAGRAVRGAEALRRGTQAAILADARLDAVTTAELADRLAHVCAVVAEAAAREAAAPEDGAQEPAADDVAGPGTAASTDPTAPAGRPSDPRPDAVEPPPHEVEIVALHGGEAAEPLRERQGDRADTGSYATAVERRLDRHAHDGSPFALLAIEADGLDRLLAAQDDGEVDALLEALERALAAELRPADQLLRQDAGRYWVTAPDTGPAVGRLLAERLAEAAGAAAAHRGAPLAVSIGVATCPDDGEDVETLAETADRALFRARAAGTPVA